MSSAQVMAATTVGNPMVLVNSMIVWRTSSALAPGLDGAACVAVHRTLRAYRGRGRQLHELS